MDWLDKVDWEKQYRELADTYHVDAESYEAEMQRLRNHVAALLHKVRGQRDEIAQRYARTMQAWCDERERVETWASATGHANARRNEVEAQLAEADAATQAALQVAARESAKAQAATAELAETLTVLTALVNASPENYGVISIIKAKARRLLAKRKERG